jgi:hypothetical protein
VSAPYVRALPSQITRATRAAAAVRAAEERVVVGDPAAVGARHVEIDVAAAPASADVRALGSAVDGCARARVVGCGPPRRVEPSEPVLVARSRVPAAQLYDHWLGVRAGDLDGRLRGRGWGPCTPFAVGCPGGQRECEQDGRREGSHVLTTPVAACPSRGAVAVVPRVHGVRESRVADCPSPTASQAAPPPAATAYFGDETVSG